MKNILIFTLLIIVMSCSSNYIHTKDLKTGEIMLLRDGHNLIKVGDTLVVSYAKGYSNRLFGLYVNKLPDSYKETINIEGKTIERDVSFKKAIRIK